MANVRGSHVHLFLLWNPQISFLLTNIELKRLHKYGHLSTNKHMKPLERAELSDVCSKTKLFLKKIEKSINSCKIYAQKQRNFEFTLQEDKHFNYLFNVIFF